MPYINYVSTETGADAWRANAGYFEYGTDQLNPVGSFPFKVDQAGNVTCNTVTANNLGGSSGGTTGWYNVKSAPYNAKGDGATDDTAAIKSAIAAAVAGVAGTVYFPQGNYVVSGNLLAGTANPSFLNFVGDGIGFPGKATQITVNDATGNTTPFGFTNTTGLITNVVIRDMTIYSGNAAAAGTGNGIFMQSTSGGSTCNQVILENLKVVNFGGSGVKIFSPIVSKIDTVYSLGNGATTGNHGFEILSASSAAWTSLNFFNCYANTNKGFGYKLATGTYSNLSACAADHNGVGGYNVNNCQGVSLAGCGTEYNSGETTTANMVQVDGGSLGIVVSGFFGYQNGHYVIYVTGSSNAVLIGCVENTPSAGAVNSFKSDAGSYVHLIEPQNTTAYALGGNYQIQDSGGQLAISGGGGTFLGTLQAAGLVTVNAGTKTSGSAPVLTPSFANGTAAQLTDTTRDYVVYLNITTGGTATTLAIGPTSGVANTIKASSTATLGDVYTVRLPAGWFLKWAGTTTAIATQLAIGC